MWDVDIGSSTLTERTRNVPLMGVQQTGDDNGVWRHIGTLTLALVPPSQRHVALVPVAQLPVATERTHFSVDDQLSRLHGMTRQKSDDIRMLARKLEQMQKALNALDAHRQELDHDRHALLQENGATERQLAELTEPLVTDLDFDLLLSLPGGIEKTMQLVTGAEVRWSRARDKVISLWGEYKQLQPQIEWVSQVQRRIQEIDAAHTEQQKAMRRAQERCREVANVEADVLHRQSMIRGLDQRARQAQGRASVPVEAALAISKERGKRDSLREVAAQLEILDRNLQPVSTSECNDCGTDRRDLALALQHGFERVASLLDEIEALRRPEDFGPRLASCRRAGAEAAEAIEALKLRHEDLSRQAEALQVKGQDQELSFARTIAQLKIRLTETEAKSMELEKRLGLPTVAA